MNQNDRFTSALNLAAARILSTHGIPTDENFDYRMSEWRGKKTHSSELLFSILDV